MNREQTARRALPLVDLTNLNEDCSHADIDALCSRAVTPHGNTAAICIWPRFVAHAHMQLRGTDLPIATVVNFPHGGTEIEITTLETRQAVADGAAEIDLVLPYEAFREGDRDTSRAMIEAVRREVPGILKVIIETGELRDETLIREASRLAIECGADFIKTSTGKVAENATLRSARIMIEEIAATGRRDIGFKPAGGIKTTEDAGDYLAIADEFMGKDWATPRTFRFGASGVLDDLLAAIEGREADASSGY